MLINEIFYSIQGEGPNVGEPQVFIRVAGCSVKCSFCDTKMSWKGGTEYSVDAIVQELRNLPRCKWVSLTGGEPLEVPFSELTDLISKVYRSGYRIEIETSGTKPIVIQWPVIWVVDFKLPSAQAKLPFIYENLSLLRGQDALKCVVSDENDLEYLKEELPRLSYSLAQIFIQPEWSKGMGWAKEVSKFAMKNEVRLSIQVHKLLGIK